MNSCVNPFAPSLDQNLGTEEGIISDQLSIGGVFKNLQYAYTFKDTLIYSQLLNNKFTFSYRDYDLGADVSWGRDQEMKVTDGLFQNAQRLDLIWNNIVMISGDSTSIIRSFNLSVTFNPTDIIFLDGRVNLRLEKDDKQKWTITHWIDESNF
ncbi:MAG: hypothetical protein KF816_07910 [Melioribacteraceae bacterium]|jgi:hypothetical protein|nr:hypothetical protein [Melioribacteraceae bacterium]